ncbi:MAG: hypothetical protein IKX88_04475 [Thermoguttaceae bacterium]|nr:hypothetical protein [Thermoguttaceae bacterium]MBR5757833.1 hypothetical protein [Thermoguttaceae bacterium]
MKQTADDSADDAAPDDATPPRAKRLSLYNLFRYMQPADDGPTADDWRELPVEARTTGR